MTQPTKVVSLPDKLKAFFGVSLPIVGLVFAARLIIDTGVRILFPFIPQLAAGLGLSVVGFSWLIFLRGMVGTAGPIFGFLSDRYGRRKLMTTGLLCQAVGLTGLTLSQQGWAAFPLLVSGLSIAAFLPPQQAYISDQVAYHRRGRALATVEFSWATAAIVMLPIAGWMIDAWGWRWPFIMLAALSLGAAGFIWWYLPPAEHHSRVSLAWPEVRRLSFQPNVLAAITVSLLLYVAVTCFIAVWGIWFTTDFGLDASALGLVATGIGLAELTASAGVGLIIDRIGKRRGSGLGLLLTAVMMFLLPFTRSDFSIAVITLITTGIFFEFSIVSLVGLYAEQAPEVRATIFSLTLLGGAVGGAIGTPITTTLWQTTGLWGVCAVATGCLFAAGGLMWKFMPERKD